MSEDQTFTFEDLKNAYIQGLIDGTYDESSGAVLDVSDSYYDKSGVIWFPQGGDLRVNDVVYRIDHTDIQLTFDTFRKQTDQDDTIPLSLFSPGRTMYTGKPSQDENQE